MQLETQGYFSICSDSNCYCVLSITSFSVAVKPHRGDLTVFQRTMSTNFSHKVCLGMEKQRGERNQPHTGCRNSLQSLCPCHRDVELKHILVSRETAPSPSLFVVNWVEQLSFTMTLFRQYARVCRTFTAWCSTIQWQKWSAAAEWNALKSISLEEKKSLFAKETENVRMFQNPKADFFLINRRYKVSYLIKNRVVFVISVVKGGYRDLP